MAEYVFAGQDTQGDSPVGEDDPGAHVWAEAVATSSRSRSSSGVAESARVADVAVAIVAARVLGRT